MENYKNFMETVKSFKKDFGSISKISNFDTLAATERKCVNELQLMLVQVEMVGRDLRSAIEKRGRELNHG